MAELKIKADSGGGTVGLKGPATTTGNAAVQLTLPVDDGTANQYLKTDGSGALSWATVASSPVTALNNATANELVTVGSTTTELDAESGLTFDGTHLSITDGNLVIATAGHGIDFSAQTATSATGASMSAELLDHYEEGSWTPVMKFGGGTTGMSATQNGTYTRIGRVVFFTAHITLSDKGSSSGTVTVDGLPFNVWGSQLTGTSLQAGIHIWFQEDMADIPNDQGSATGYIASGPTITFRYFDSNNNSGSNLTDSHLADTSSWRFSGQYFVA